MAHPPSWLFHWLLQPTIFRVGLFLPFGRPPIKSCGSFEAQAYYVGEAYQVDRKRVCVVQMTWSSTLFYFMMDICISVIVLRCIKSQDRRTVSIVLCHEISLVRMRVLPNQYLNSTWKLFWTCPPLKSFHSSIHVSEHTSFSGNLRFLSPCFIGMRAWERCFVGRQPQGKQMGFEIQ